MYAPSQWVNVTHTHTHTHTRARTHAHRYAHMHGHTNTRTLTHARTRARAHTLTWSPWQFSCSNKGAYRVHLVKLSSQMRWASFMVDQSCTNSFERFPDRALEKKSSCGCSRALDLCTELVLAPCTRKKGLTWSMELGKERFAIRRHVSTKLTLALGKSVSHIQEIAGQKCLLRFWETQSICQLPELSVWLSHTEKPDCPGRMKKQRHTMDSQGMAHVLAIHSHGLTRVCHDGQTAGGGQSGACSSTD